MAEEEGGSRLQQRKGKEVGEVSDGKISGGGGEAISKPDRQRGGQKRRMRKEVGEGWDGMEVIGDVVGAEGGGREERRRSSREMVGSLRKCRR